MKRREDWPERLNVYLDSVRKTLAEWGTFDCCLMAADAVLAMTEVDCAAEFRGKYSDADGAFALVQARGGSMEAMLDGIAKKYDWGAPESLKHIQRGDVCLLSPAVIAGENRFGGVAGICFGRFVAYVGPRVLLATSLDHVVKAWHF